MKLKFAAIILFLSLFSFSEGNSQKVKVPEIHSNIHTDNQGLYLDVKGKKYYAEPEKNGYSPEMFYQNIRGMILDNIRLSTGSSIILESQAE